MRKYVKIVYGISLALVILMLTCFFIYRGVDETVARENAGYRILTDYEMTTYENEAAPVGKTQEYRWIVEDVVHRNSCITFYTIHQEIEIYIEDQLLYQLTANDAKLFSKTTGCDWAKAYIGPDDIGKELRILVHPIYETSISNELKIYFGTYEVIRSRLVLNDAFVLCMGLAAITIGVALIIFVWINFRNNEMDRSIAMLGLFSVFVGVWKVSDMPSASILFGNAQALSATAIISLSMMVTPYIFFVRNQFAKERHKFWDVMCLCCSLVSIVIVVLQLTGTADLRETLTVCHVMVVIVVVSIMGMLIWEAIHTKYSVKLKITVICCVLCLFGTMMDMTIYYYSADSGSMIYCMMAFLIYVIAMGWMAVKEARQLIERGRDAKHYEQLAMHDELTGLYNRAFYSQYTKMHDMHRDDCYVVIFDVNNLKQCNDDNGHDEGDRLLKNCAQIIEKSFGPNARCIRMGGDEFWVILRHVHEGECKAWLKQFDEMCNEFNASHPDEYRIAIAYGYAHFNEAKDFDFGDTVRRADKNMYQMKVAMKAIEKARVRADAVSN